MTREERTSQIIHLVKYDSSLKFILPVHVLTSFAFAI